MGDNMTKAKTAWRGVLCASLVVAGASAAIDQAEAGGFAVREQSSSYLGSAFAGSASMQVELGKGWTLGAQFDAFLGGDQTDVSGTATIGWRF